MSRWVAFHGLLAGLAAGAVLVVADVLLSDGSTGMFAHFVCAVLAAVGFAGATASMPELTRSPGTIHVAGLLIGALTWLHALYVVLPALGHGGVPASSNATLQLTVHLLVYGVGIAGWLDARLPRRSGFLPAFVRAGSA